MKTPKTYVWVVAYINYDLIHKVVSDLQKNRQYRNIEFNIPTVRVLKKKSKGKEHFKEVPLLFNYGFFKIPIGWALNVDLLNKIKGDISCISNWVKDRAKNGTKDPSDEFKRPYEFSERDVPIATTTEACIDEMCKLADELSIFSSDDINRVKEGDIITLMKYPFENLKAKVLTINKQNKSLKVAIENSFEEDVFDLIVDVKFENIFYSIYQGSHDEKYGEENLLEDYHINRRKNKTEEDEF